MDFHVDYSGPDIPRLRSRKSKPLEKNSPGTKKHPLFQPQTREETFLSESKVRDWLSRKSENVFEEKDFSLDQIQISEQLPTDFRRNLRAANREFSAAFPKTNRVPPLFKCEPHVIPLKTKFEIQRAAPRRRGPHSQEYLKQWATKEIAQGGYEHCDGLWASEMHLAHKAGPDGKSDHALDPIRRMKEPHDRKSLRSALGIFVSSSRMIPNYSILTKPLTRLTAR